MVRKSKHGVKNLKNVGKSNLNYKQGFCTNADVFIMDEGIEMMPIEQTSSESQFTWWVSQVSTTRIKSELLKHVPTALRSLGERGGRISK